MRLAAAVFVVFWCAAAARADAADTYAVRVLRSSREDVYLEVVGGR